MSDHSVPEQLAAVAVFLRPLANLLRSNPECQVNVEHTSNLLSAAEALLQDPSLGINMARQSEYSVFGGLGLALSAGGSLLSVLQRMPRYHRLISNVVRTELVVDEDTVSIHFY